MSKVQRPCRVCGKLYTPCSNCDNDNTVFHWRKVACSYECGEKYLEAVMKARSEENTPAPKPKTSKKSAVQKALKEEREIPDETLEAPTEE